MEHKAGGASWCVVVVASERSLIPGGVCLLSTRRARAQLSSAQLSSHCSTRPLHVSASLALRSSKRVESLRISSTHKCNIVSCSACSSLNVRDIV